MKRLTILIPASFSIIILLAACSGYFTNEGINTDKEKIAKLEIAGGGYLSTDEFNEITPFLYRDGGKAWLFFASDRSGGQGKYDIYMAQMNGDGTFGSPQPLNNNINTADDEISPVVYKATNSGGVTNTFISFIRKASPVRIWAVPLNASLNGTSAGQSASMNGDDGQAAGLGIVSNSAVPPMLLVSTNGASMIVGNWDAGLLSWGSSGTKSFGTSDKMNSCSGWLDGAGTAFFFANNSAGNFQLYGAYAGTVTNVSKLSIYSSPFNDKDPFVDQDTKKVYFASDRYGDGNYDLYRYNTLTADVALPLSSGSFWGPYQGENAIVNITNNGTPAVYSGFAYTLPDGMGYLIYVANTYDNLTNSTVQSYFLMQISNTVIATGTPYSATNDCKVYVYSAYSAMTGSASIATNGTVTFSSIAESVGGHWTGTISATGYTVAYPGTPTPCTLNGTFDIVRYGP